MTSDFLEADRVRWGPRPVIICSHISLTVNVVQGDKMRVFCQRIAWVGECCVAVLLLTACGSGLAVRIYPAGDLLWHYSLSSFVTQQFNKHTKFVA